MMRKPVMWLCVLVSVLSHVSLGWTQEQYEESILLDRESDVLGISAPFDAYLDLGYTYKVELVSDMRARDIPIKEVVVCVDAVGYPAMKIEEGLPASIRLSEKQGYSGGARILVPSPPFTIQGGATVTFSRKEWSEEVRIDGERNRTEDVGRDVTLEAGAYRVASNMRSPVVLMVSRNRDPYGWFEVLEVTEPGLLLLDDEEKSRVRVIVLKIGDARTPRKTEVSFIQRVRMEEILRRF